MTESVAVWGNQYAPITSSMGFLRAPLAVVADRLTAWRRDIHGLADACMLDGGFVDNVNLLEPLTAGVRPRELVVGTANQEWTAVFDCGFQGGDPVSTIGTLALLLKVQGVAVTSIPDLPVRGALPELFGARQFEMFGPLLTNFINHVRAVSVVRDWSHWRFDASGTVQDFEDLEAYKRRKITDRFTSSMLVDYAAALGLRPFDDDFFPGPCVLVQNPAVPPPGAIVVSLADAQRRAGIVPQP